MRLSLIMEEKNILIGLRFLKMKKIWLIFSPLNSLECLKIFYNYMVSATCIRHHIKHVVNETMKKTHKYAKDLFAVLFLQGRLMPIVSVSRVCAVTVRSWKNMLAEKDISIILCLHQQNVQFKGNISPIGESKNIKKIF